ncbi:tripartite tricarboxylate transporter substrate binding protein [Variovorax sp. J31P179]|uniref:Bug family tripartite tricarboxylate transporter substrate binding protein n=1 Tax=Variovorax sp. J31P179 TaxID=3053508 RepID=UPI0025767222|nr:tripartite tricarboxylate transporter substrate binding protein [Variovorax sp. J31P179]MDM0085452.1 tripartite tricarboxylate transporter substrate binding protein [Variovorax sp. J31P179]
MTVRFTRRRCDNLLAVAFATLAMTSSFAQAPSDKPVRVIAFGPPGGSVDFVSRLLAEGLQKELNRTVIVEAKPGGGGAPSVNELMQSPHDGNTLLVSLDALVSEIPHSVKLRFDMSKEVKPIAELARGGLVMVGHPSLPVKSLAEVVTYVKANPGKVSYASYSAGTVSHVLGLQLNKTAGIDMAHIGYKGSPPALVDVVGGHVPLMFAGIPSAMPLIKAGKIVPYAVSLPQRSPMLPNVPTFAELGYPQLEALGWMGLWVTPSVPATVQNRLREAALKVMTQPTTRERLKEFGLDAGQPRTPDELSKSLRSDYERVGAVLASINFKPE